MQKKRIIPLLLFKDKRLYKGKKFENLIDVGDLVSTIKIYNNQLSDELILININEDSSFEDNYFIDLLKEASKNCFVPLSIGGRIKKMNDIEKVLKSGADKVIICSEIVNNLNFLKEASFNFGSQCIIAGVEYQNLRNNDYVTFNRKKKKSKYLVKDYIKLLEDNGAGEIILVDTDRDGIMNGVDIENIKKYTKTIKVPTIISGGIASALDIVKIFKETDANAVACGSLFYFGDNTPIRLRFSLKNYGIDVRKAR